jgi:putative alpha-1,2-mannosidase
MLKDASVPPANAQKEGRGGILDYNAKGYITLADERSGSRTVEYAYDDFAIAEVACGLNRHPGRSEALRQPRQQLAAPVGQEHEAPKASRASCARAIPTAPGPRPTCTVRGTWPDFFYEGDIWTYSLYAPQDMRRLIQMAGGNDAFVAGSTTSSTRSTSM